VEAIEGKLFYTRFLVNGNLPHGALKRRGEYWGSANSIDYGKPEEPRRRKEKMVGRRPNVGRRDIESIVT
jgi:hypothetical protein